MKLLVTGANGQVGRALRDTLKPLGEVIASSRNGQLHDHTQGIALDLSQPHTLVSVLDAVQPDMLVNAAAWTAVDAAETESAAAWRVNAEAVGVLARWAADHGVPMVHYSTDYVFNGKPGPAWREDDPVAPLGVYGASKLAGEEELAASGAAHLLLRTAWVYDAQGRNFLRTMLRLAGERDELRVVDDQIGTPTPAHLIAAVTAHCLRQWLDADTDTRAHLSGTYHLVADGHVSWHGFASAIFEQAVTRGLLVHAPRVQPIPSSDFPTPARRPAWSVLDSGKLRRTFGLELPSWQQGLAQVLDQMAPTPQP